MIFRVIWYHHLGAVKQLRNRFFDFFNPPPIIGLVIALWSPLFIAIFISNPIFISLHSKLSIHFRIQNFTFEDDNHKHDLGLQQSVLGSLLIFTRKKERNTLKSKNNRHPWGHSNLKYGDYFSSLPVSTFHISERNQFSEVSNKLLFIFRSGHYWSAERVKEKSHLWKDLNFHHQAVKLQQCNITV